MNDTERLLCWLQQGCVLKVHRTLDGSKVYQVHGADNGVIADVAGTVVFRLEQRGLIQSNMKFPVATFSLTPMGRGATQSRESGLTDTSR